MRDRVPLARDMRETVGAWTGIPTCVGIGATKTLAKLANHVAKTVPELGGVCDLTDPVQYDHWMARIAPNEIWGVGPANAQAGGSRLRQRGRRARPRRPDGAQCDDGGQRAPGAGAARRALPRPGGDRAEPEGLRRHLQLLRPGRGSRHDGAGGCRARDPARRALAGEGLGTDHLTVFFHTSEHNRDRPQRSVSTAVARSRS